MAVSFHLFQSSWLTVIDDVVADLTTAPRESIPQADMSRRPISSAVEQLEAGSIPATWPPADAASSIALQAQALPLAVIPEAEAIIPIKPLPSRRMKQGLPSGVKLNISSPIVHPTVERSTAYERPRPVPRAK